MAVTIEKEDPTFLDFKFTNGDFSKLKEVMERWEFKDYQSFFRFAISIMLATEDKFLAILENAEPKTIKPAAEYLKQS